MMYSASLFPRSSFWEGAARIIDIGGMLSQYNISPTPDIADGRALTADWLAVAEDLRVAMSSLDPTILDKIEQDRQEFFEQIHEFLALLIEEYESKLAIHE